MDRRDFLRSFFSVLAYSSLPQFLRPSNYDENEKPYRICDTHIHLFGTSPENGCYISPVFQKSLVYNLQKLFVDIPSGDDSVEQDRLYVRKLVNLLDESAEHKYGIILSLDAVYDNRGNYDYDQTSVYIPNDYLFSVCAKNEKFVPGASVNPNRKDALNELHRTFEMGTVLIKWLPNTQNIDPSDPRLIPFYRKLVELDLPLLTHGGSEDAIPALNQEYGNPDRLHLPLEEGVTVIVAHLAVGSRIVKGTYFHQFLEMMEKYPNLYGEISSMTMLQKSYWTNYILEHPALFQRLYYGSDFPLQFFPVTSPLYFLGEIPLENAWEIQKIENVLIRDVETWKALGAPKTFFERGINLVEKKSVTN